MPNVGNGTGFDGMPPENEGLSHYGGDEVEKLAGVIAGGQMGAHGGTAGHGGNRETPIGPQPEEELGLRATRGVRRSERSATPEE